MKRFLLVSIPEVEVVFGNPLTRWFRKPKSSIR